MHVPAQDLRQDYLRHDKKFPHVWCPGCGNGIVMGSLLRAINALELTKEKLDEAVEKNAEIIVSACPACKLAFVDGIREHSHDIEVRDIHELIAMRLGVLE